MHERELEQRSRTEWTFIIDTMYEVLHGEWNEDRLGQSCSVMHVPKSMFLL